MRRSPFIVLVCLLFYISTLDALAAFNQDTIDVIVGPTEPHEASFDLFPSNGQEPLQLQQAAASSMWGAAPPQRPRYFAQKPIVKCKPPICSPVGFCAVKPSPPCTLPIRRCGQWELATQVFFARVRGTVQWPALVLGIPATPLDLNDDLGIPSHQTLLEYSGRYQFRPHWAIYYSIMPISLEGTATPERTLYFGQFPIPAGVPVHTKWDFLYQRVGLMYQPIVSCNATVSIYSAWLFNDQRVQSSNALCPLSPCSRVDRTRNMVMSGIEMQKCIRTLCNGGTFSCDNRIGLGYLDGTFAMDLETGFRFSVPMNCGRWGFVRGGYRLINFTEDRNDLRLDTVLEGGFVEGGLIF